MRAKPFFAAAVAGLCLMAAQPVAADKIKNPVAVFSGLDKITGRIVSFEALVDETVQFGALQLTPRICFSRPPTESPNTTSFVEVDEVTLENTYQRIFTGWVFASSPGLSAIEHAVYDIWLVECKGGTEIIVEAPEPEEEVTPTAAEGTEPFLAPLLEPLRPAEPAPAPEIAPTRPVERPRPAQPPRQRFFPTDPSMNR